MTDKINERPAWYVNKTDTYLGSRGPHQIEQLDELLIYGPYAKEVYSVDGRLYVRGRLADRTAMAWFFDGVGARDKVKES